MAPPPAPPPAAPPPSPPLGLKDALERETKRICQSSDIQSALSQVVTFQPTLGVGGPRHLTRPSFTLTFNWHRGVINTTFPAALKALATVLAHSFRVNKLPSLKTKLWRRILEYMVAQEGHKFEKTNVDAYIWLVEDESFPVFTIDMSQNGQMTSHADAFMKFFTTPPETEMDPKYVRQCEQFAPNKIGVELNFKLCKLTPASLRLIDTMLDRIYASPTRQFAVTVLDFSEQVMDDSHFDVVADIVENIQDVYHDVTEVRLLIPNSLNEPPTSAKIQAALQNVIVAACDTTMYQMLESPSSLKELNLNGNKLSVKNVAAICSALRYRCQIESLSLTRTFNYDMNEADMRQCWRWIAYGMFYPRSRKLAADNKFRSVDLSNNYFPTKDHEAFNKTLSNPAAELVYRGKSKRQFVKDELRLCTIKEGAKFYPTTKAGAKVIHELESEMELEALCQENGLTCIVLPGIGFGWVKDDEIISTEIETIDDSYRDDISVGLTFMNMSIGVFNPQPIASFFKHVGCYLTYLKATGIGPVTVLLRAILQHCTKLEHLNLGYNDLIDESLDLLLKAFKGGLGDRLISLDISSGHFSTEGIEKLSKFLSDSTRLPALVEFSMVMRPMDDRAYASLRRAFAMNKRLWLVELLSPYLYPNSDQEDVKVFIRSMEECERIEELTNEKLLPLALPLNQKLAFLGAIQHESVVGTPRRELDKFMVSSIFQFAANDVRRRVVWDKALF